MSLWRLRIHRLLLFTGSEEELEKRAFAEDAIEISKREQYRENEKQRKLMGYCHFKGVIY
jgi:hypothetical protein